MTFAESSKPKNNVFREPQDDLGPPTFARRDTGVRVFVCVGVGFLCKRQDRRNLASHIISTSPRELRANASAAPRRDHQMSVRTPGKAPLPQWAFSRWVQKAQRRQLNCRLATCIFTAHKGSTSVIPLMACFLGAIRSASHSPDTSFRASDRSLQVATGSFARKILLQNAARSIQGKVSVGSFIAVCVVAIS